MEPIDAPTPDPCLIEHAGQYKMSSLCEVITVSGHDSLLWFIAGVVVGVFCGAILCTIFS